MNTKEKTIKEIQLIPFEESKFDIFINWVKNEDFMVQFAGSIFNFPITHQQLHAYLNHENRKVYSIIYKDDKQVIGHIEIDRIDLVHRSARISRFLIGDEDNRSKGVGRQALEKAKDIVFNDLSINRLELVVLEGNQSAIRCYENCGFKTEGILRESYILNDIAVSSRMMSILFNEYQSDLANLSAGSTIIT